MERPRCTVTIEEGLTHPHRGVAFLEHPATYVNAKPIFDTLSKGSERYHRKSFDYWMGNHSTDRFHGYKKSYHSGKYVWCFTFRNIAMKERFYGFLCNPKPDDPDYRLCVLAVYAQKKEDAQDLAELDRVERLRIDKDVHDALNDPDLFLVGRGKNYDE